MVSTFHANLVEFLGFLHRTRRAAGVEELTRSGGPDPRTVYRWHADLGDRLTYFPSVTFGALRLVHAHLFIDGPSGAWEQFPYAVRAEWTVISPGTCTLYLHCLIPREHVRECGALLQEFVRRGNCATARMITSSDGWQVLGTIPQPAAADEVPDAALRAATHDIWDVIERFPLLLPVIFEVTESRRSMPEVWSAIYARLGKQTWEYLPRFARRLPTNGKQYVKQAYDLLNETGIFRQHVVRYEPLNDLSTPMLLHMRGDARAIIQALAQHAPTLDVYPIDAAEVLVRVQCTHAILQRILSMTALPRIIDWHFIDTQHPRPVVRFAYEILFDPSTTEWVFPRALIIARISR